MSRFYVWIDSPVADNNILSAAGFNDDTQRTNGFVAGQPASSIRVNTALRQANLVAAALMNVIDTSNTYDVTSSLDDVTTGVRNFFNTLASANTQFTQASTRTNLTSGDSLSTQLGKISKWFADLKALAFTTIVGTANLEGGSVTESKLADGAVTTAKLASNAKAPLAGSADKATADGDGNNIKNTYAKQSGTYSSMTVGNATNATNATKIAGTDNGSSITITLTDNSTIVFTY